MKKREEIIRYRDKLFTQFISKVDLKSPELKQEVNQIMDSTWLADASVTFEDYQRKKILKDIYINIQKTTSLKMLNRLFFMLFCGFEFHIISNYMFYVS